MMRTIILVALCLCVLVQGAVTVSNTPNMQVQQESSHEQPRQIQMPGMQNPSQNPNPLNKINKISTGVSNLSALSLEDAQHEASPTPLTTTHSEEEQEQAQEMGSALTAVPLKREDQTQRQELQEGGVETGTALESRASGQGAIASLTTEDVGGVGASVTACTPAFGLQSACLEVTITLTGALTGT
ncbi:hypothetical protein B484DRAFT_286256, partial [Ochromonadaceae sp. CCMP2298]